MKQLIEIKLEKYNRYISNIHYHIDNNNPTPIKINSLQDQLIGYREVVNDLKDLLNLVK